MRKPPRTYDPAGWKDNISPLSRMSDEDFEKLDAQMSASIEEAQAATVARLQLAKTKKRGQRSNGR